MKITDWLNTCCPTVTQELLLCLIPRQMQKNIMLHTTFKSIVHNNILNLIQKTESGWWYIKRHTSCFIEHFINMKCFNIKRFCWNVTFTFSFLLCLLCQTKSQTNLSNGLVSNSSFVKLIFRKRCNCYCIVIVVFVVRPVEYPSSINPQEIRHCPLRKLKNVMKQTWQNEQIFYWK